MRTGKDFSSVRPTYIFPVRLQMVMQSDCIDTTDVARMVDESEDCIRGYLDGYRIPSLENAIRIARKLDVSLDWLCGLGE